MSDHGDSNHLLNTGQFLLDYTPQHPRRQSSHTRRRENLKSHLIVFHFPSLVLFLPCDCCSHTTLLHFFQVPWEQTEDCWSVGSNRLQVWVTFITSGPQFRIWWNQNILFLWRRRKCRSILILIRFNGSAETIPYFQGWLKRPSAFGSKWLTVGITYRVIPTVSSPNSVSMVTALYTYRHSLQVNFNRFE
jgi:hypothetical protein